MTELPKSPKDQTSNKDDTKSLAKDNSLGDKSKSTEKVKSSIEKSVAAEKSTPPAKSSAQAPVAADKTEKKPVKTGLLWFFTFINFVILAAICAAAYWYYTQIASTETTKQTDIVALKQTLENQSGDFQSSLGLVKQSTQNIESNLANVKQSATQNLSNVESQLSQSLANVESKLSQNLANMQSELSQANATVDTINKRLAEMSGRRPSDWLLAEANYLVNMAGRKLYMEKDVRTAMTLLTEADGRLQDLNDPSLFPVRALISADVQALAQVNPVSTNSIALAIAGMLPTVKELSLDTLQLPEFNNEEDLTLSENVSEWRQNLKKTWRAVVNDLISIDYVDEPLEPYLAQRQQWLIEQQLNFALTQAQSAALNEQVALYRSSIQRAIAILVEHYKIDETRVSQFLVALQELQTIDFSRQYPASLASQASLKAIIDKRIESLYNNSNMNADEKVGNPL